LAAVIKNVKIDNNKSFQLQVWGVALSGLIASLAGEFLSDYGVALGLAEPDCDGPVFDTTIKLRDAKTIPGITFADGISKGVVQLNQPFEVFSQTDDTHVSQTHCGHNPSTTSRRQEHASPQVARRSPSLLTMS